MTVSPRARRGHIDWLPPVAGIAVALVGLLSVASTLDPYRRWHAHVMEPVRAIPVLHAFALPGGVALLLTAASLGRRRRRAWQATVGLLLVLGVLDVLKGFDVLEALVKWGLAGLLWSARDAFRVRHDPVTLRSAVWRVPALVVFAVALTALAVWAAPTRPARPSVDLVLREASDLLLWQPGPLGIEGGFDWLPLAIGLVSLGVLFASAYLIFRPLAAPRRLPDAEARGIAEQLVRRHGSDTLAFFKLRQDQPYLFSPDRRAFVAYRIEGGVLLLAGDPVGAPEALPELIDEVIALAQQRGLRVGALGASERLLPLYEAVGLRSLYIGDEAIVDLERFSLEGRPIRKVRQSVHRLERAGYTAELHLAGALDEATLAELERVHEHWREGVPERGFAMSMDSLRGAHQRDTVVVVARDEHGRVRAYMHLVPTYGRPAMSLSIMPRERDTPNGLSESLVVSAIALLRARGTRELSLNFAAFSRLTHSPAGHLERALGHAVVAASAFLQMESLYRFNAKFLPRWEARYLIYQGPLGMTRAGLAAMLAEGQLPKPGQRDRSATPVG